MQVAVVGLQGVSTARLAAQGIGTINERREIIGVDGPGEQERGVAVTEADAPPAHHQVG